MSPSSFSLLLKNRKKTHTQPSSWLHPSLSDSTLAASDQTTLSKKRSLIGWHTRENRTRHIAWFEIQTMSSTTPVTQTGGGKGQLLRGNLRQWRVYRYQKSGRALLAPSWQHSVAKPPWVSERIVSVSPGHPQKPHSRNIRMKMSKRCLPAMQSRASHWGKRISPSVNMHNMAQKWAAVPERSSHSKWRSMLF